MCPCFVTEVPLLLLGEKSRLGRCSVHPGCGQALRAHVCHGACAELVLSFV